MRRSYWFPALLSLIVMSFGAMPVDAKTILNIVGHWAPAPAAKFMEMAGEYMTLNPDIELRYIHAPTSTYEGISKILLMTGNEETNPDVINMYTAVAPGMIAGGAFAPVPSALAQTARRFFVPQLLQGLTFQGQIYGIPSQNQAYTLGYNERVFIESGIVKPPADWDELVSYARKLARVSGDGKVARIGLTMGGNAGEFARQFINLVWANGGEYIDDNGKVHLNTLPVSETVEYLTDMVKRGVARVVAPLGLGDGSHAMALLPNYRKQNLVTSPDYAQIRTVTAPTNRGNKPVSYQYGWGLHVSKKSRHPEEAWRFLQWLTMERGKSGSTRMGEYMASLGSLPTNSVDLNAHKEYKDLFYTGFLASLNIARNEPLLPKITERQQVIHDQVTPVINGAKSLAGMLEELQARVEELLQG